MIENYEQQIENLLPDSLTDEEHSKIMNIVSDMQERLKELSNDNEAMELAIRMNTKYL